MSFLFGRKSPLILYWKIDFFEVYKRCRAHLSTLCIGCGTYGQKPLLGAALRGELAKICPVTCNSKHEEPKLKTSFLAG